MLPGAEHKKAMGLTCTAQSEVKQAKSWRPSSSTGDGTGKWQRYLVGCTSASMGLGYFTLPISGCAPPWLSFFFFNVFFQYYSVAHSSVVIWIWNYVPRGKSSCLCTASWKSWYFWSVRLLFIHLFIYLNLNSAVHPSVKRGTAEFSICNASVFSLAGRGKMWAWEGRIQHPALLLA